MHHSPGHSFAMRTQMMTSQTSSLLSPYAGHTALPQKFKAKALLQMEWPRTETNSIDSSPPAVESVTYIKLNFYRLIMCDLHVQFFQQFRCEQMNQ